MVDVLTGLGFPPASPDPTKNVFGMTRPFGLGVPPAPVRSALPQDTPPGILGIRSTPTIPTIGPAFGPGGVTTAPPVTVPPTYVPPGKLDQPLPSASAPAGGGGIGSDASIPLKPVPAPPPPRRGFSNVTPASIAGIASMLPRQRMPNEIASDAILSEATRQRDAILSDASRSVGEKQAAQNNLLATYEKMAQLNQAGNQQLLMQLMGGGIPQ